MTNLVDGGEQVDATAEFAGRIYSRLSEDVPTIGELPLIYLGSGGDIASALVATHATKIIMVDKTPFLTEDPIAQKQSDSVERVMKEVKDRRITMGSVASGRFTHFMRVRPARHALTGLASLGVDLDTVDIETRSDGSAKLKFKLAGRQVNVEYVCSERIDDVGDFLSSEIGVNNGQYGLMVKAGEHLGRDIMYFVQNLDEKHSNAAPTYIVSDDPRSYLGGALTLEDEAAQYPGYSVTEIVGSDTHTRWGYAFGQEMYDAVPDGWRQYGARAVVCVKQQ